MIEFGRFTEDADDVIHTTSTSLINLSYDNLKTLVNNRLIGKPSDKLSRSYHDDPSDILIDIFSVVEKIPQYDTFVSSLRRICAEFSLEVSIQPDEKIIANIEGVGELLFMSARINAEEAAPHIASLCRREALKNMMLSSGEHLHSRAVRSLAGLLSEADLETKGKYKDIIPQP